MEHSRITVTGVDFGNFENSCAKTHNAVYIAVEVDVPK